MTFPTTHCFGLDGVSQENVDLGRAHELWVLPIVRPPVLHAYFCEREGEQALDVAVMRARRASSTQECVLSAPCRPVILTRTACRLSWL